MEIGAEAAAVVAAAIGSKDVINKLLGPTAAYLGDELQYWTKRRVENIGRIFRKAEDKLGDRINEPGRVHPKVLKEILDDGSFAEDELAAEYFGGVLASSRSGVDRDDRGAAFAKLVAGLTTYQLRSHYLFYDGFKRLFNGIYGPDAIFLNMHRLEMFVPDSDYSESLSIEEGETFDDIELHSVIGLVRNDLIAPQTLGGSVAFLKAQGYAAEEDGQMVGVTMAGIELFHWAHGLGDLRATHFLDPTVDYEFEASIRKLTKIKPSDLPLPEPEGWPGSVLPVTNPLV